jgi:hypothetical protein
MAGSNTTSIIGILIQKQKISYRIRNLTGQLDFAIQSDILPPTIVEKARRPSLLEIEGLIFNRKSGSLRASMRTEVIIDRFMKLSRFFVISLSVSLAEERNEPRMQLILKLPPPCGFPLCLHESCRAPLGSPWRLFYSHIF